MSVKVSFRLDNSLYDSLRTKCPSVSDGCRTAIKNYLSFPPILGGPPIIGPRLNGPNGPCGPSMLENAQYSRELVEQLRSENQYLRGIHDKLLNRAVMLPEYANSGVGMAEDGLEPLETVYTVNTPKKPLNTSENLRINNNKKVIINKKNQKKKGFWHRLGF